METVQNKKKEQIIDFSRLWTALLRRKTTYFKVIPTTVLVVWIISLGLPDYYKCKIQLIPESNSGGGSGTLALLASSFGVNIGGGVSGSDDAITAFLYPDVMSSVEFKAELFKVMIQRPTDKAPMTYYDYLKDEQKDAWWISAREGLLDVFWGQQKIEKKAAPVNPYELTPEQMAISGAVSSKIKCDFNTSKSQQTLIAVEVIDQEPYVAAQVADSVKQHLQDYITDYKTRKARYDLKFTEKLYKEAKKNYERARQLYADFMDSNQDIMLENVRQKQTDLENEMQLLYNNYNALSTQLLAAKVRVQEVTPAFTTLQASTVPLWPEGPNRSRIVVLFTIVALFFTTIWILFDEDEIRPLLGLTDDEEDEVVE